MNPHWNWETEYNVKIVNIFLAKIFLYNFNVLRYITVFESYVWIIRDSGLGLANQMWINIDPKDFFRFDMVKKGFSEFLEGKE